jgi:hypothetical protein
MVLTTGLYNKTKTVKEFVEARGFSKEAINYMDRLCRLTDGAGYDKYTMFKFLQLGNQNFFYKFVFALIVLAPDKIQIDWLLDNLFVIVPSERFMRDGFTENC